MISYTQNKATYIDVLGHLQGVSNSFTVPLEKRVNLSEYAKKIVSIAHMEEAWEDDKLIGLFAYYVNNEQSDIFITNVSVIHKYQGKGIGSKLINAVKTIALKNNFRIIRLWVADDSEAVKFYERNGFNIGKQLPNNEHEMFQYVSNIKPIVSICCLVYNHEKYLRDCFEGFMSQQTSFPFEVLIHEDASTDKSADIVREYENKYPNIFRPIYQDINQYSQGVPITETYQLPRAQGMYIATCEGDDYWTDPIKLQKQVDFLENHSDSCMCVHATKWEVGENYETRGCEYKSECDLTTEEVIENGGLYLSLASTVYRRNIFPKKDERPLWWKLSDVGDYPMHIYATLIGNVHFFPEQMCVYRYQHEGSWTSKEKQINYSHLVCEITWMQLFNVDTNHRYEKAIYNHLFTRFFRTLYRENKISTKEYVKAYTKASKSIPMNRFIKDIIRHFVKRE